MLNILDLLFTVCAIGNLISIVAFILMMVFVKRLNPKLVLIMISVFVMTILIAFIFPTIARNEIREKLNDDVVSIISNETFNRYKMLNAIKSISSPKEKPHPETGRFWFEVKLSNEDLYLELAKDSVNENVLYVYYPKYRFSQMNYIGVIEFELN